jgi:hypothetical protein
VSLAAGFFYLHTRLKIIFFEGMKYNIIIALFGMTAMPVIAQEGTNFPLLVGQTLDNKVIDLPDGIKGKYALLGLARSKKAEPDFESWVNPVYNKFIARTGMMDDMYDISVFFIPMFTGVRKGAMEEVMERMKAKSAKEIFPHVLFYKGDAAPYEKPLGLEDKDKPYIYLLDKEGTILLRFEGKFKEAYMDQIEKMIDL